MAKGKVSKQVVEILVKRAVSTVCRRSFTLSPAYKADQVRAILQGMCAPLPRGTFKMIQAEVERIGRIVDQRRAARHIDEEPTLQERLYERIQEGVWGAARRADLRRADRDGSKWVDTVGHYIDVQIGEPDAAGRSEKVWDTKFRRRKWSATTSRWTITVRRDWLSRVVHNGPGALVGGKLILDAEPTKNGKAWRVTYAAQSRGYSLVARTARVRREAA